MSLSSSTSVKLSRLQSATDHADYQSILIVDDDSVARALLTQYIGEIGGFKLEFAGSQAEATLLLQHDIQRYFCAVVNYSLPDAPHGEAVQAIGAAGLPAIVLTDSSEERVLGKIRGQHVVDYVLKNGVHQIEHVAYIIGRLRENRTKKILVVDDSRCYRLYLTALLDRYFYTTLQASDGVEAMEVLAAHPDLTLVLTDINMPRLDGFGLIAEIRQRYRREDLAIIGVSDSSQTGMSARILKAGGNDFLPKPFEQEEFYCRVTQNTNMIGYVRQIRDSANIDFLTGVYNRRHLFDIGGKLYANARRGNINLAASLIDADHFKRINDTHGHQVGDLALKAIANRLTSALRTGDVVARYGGEEFVCLAVLKQPGDAGLVFERVRREIESLRLEVGGATIPITASLGVTTMLDDNFEAMLRRADEAVYLAKKGGRNRVVEV